METKELAKLLGISHQLCNRHRKRGMPCDSLESAVKWRKANLDIVRTKAWRVDSNPGTCTNETQAIDSKSIEELKQQVEAIELDLEVEDAETLYRNARAMRMKYEALLAIAEREMLIGSLIDKKTVEKFVFETARELRDRLMTCARRLAPELASMEDVKEVESLLSREYRALLENFVKMMENKRNSNTQ